MTEQPIAALLFCPYCGMQHVDVDEWATRPHHKHLCARCGKLWRVEPYCVGKVGTPFSEDRRQAIVLALAELSLRRPGWLDYLRDIVGDLFASKMFDSFRETSGGVIKPDPERVQRLERIVENFVTHLREGGPNELLWSHLRTFLVQEGYDIPEEPAVVGASRDELIAEVLRLKSKCARFTAYAEHHGGCEAWVRYRREDGSLSEPGACDCGLSRVYADVNIGLILPDEKAAQRDAEMVVGETSVSPRGEGRQYVEPPSRTTTAPGGRSTSVATPESPDGSQPGGMPLSQPGTSPLGGKL